MTNDDNDDDNDDVLMEIFLMTNNNDTLVMYLIVKETLNMSVGKIATQVGHAVDLMKDKFSDILLCEQKMYYGVDEKKIINEIEIINNWLHLSNGGRRKVALRADDKEWIKIKNEYPDSIVVIDAGITEINPGSETVIALFPMLKSERSKTLKRLRTL